MDLFVDGNIAQTFSPEGAVRFFTRLLGVDARSLRPTISQESPHAFFITSFAMQSACPSFAVNGRPLDYVISQAGTVVPQRMWSSRVYVDSQHNTNTSLNMPVYFVHNDRATIGLPLLKAVEGSRATLLGAGDAAPIGNVSSMCIRINWPGYGDWRSQVMTKDQTSAHNTITVEKFAKRVAATVCRFLDQLVEAERLEGQDPNWRIGAGGITKEQVILIGVVHVSQGSWQPILQLNHYVVPRCQHIPGLP